MWINKAALTGLQDELLRSRTRETELQQEIEQLRQALSQRDRQYQEKQQNCEKLLSVVQRMGAFGLSLTQAQSSLGEMASLLREEQERARTSLVKWS